jgi:hypothetical protein
MHSNLDSPIVFEKYETNVSLNIKIQPSQHQFISQNMQNGGGQFHVDSQNQQRI